MVHLKDSSLTLFEEYIDSVKKRYEETQQKHLKEVACLVMAEYTYCLLHFYKYD